MRRGELGKKVSPRENWRRMWGMYGLFITSETLAHPTRLTWAMTQTRLPRNLQTATGIYALIWDDYDTLEYKNSPRTLLSTMNEPSNSLTYAEKSWEPSSGSTRILFVSVEEGQQEVKGHFDLNAWTQVLHRSPPQWVELRRWEYCRIVKYR